MKIELTENEWAALSVLKSTGVDTLEAALIAREAVAAGRGRVRRARQCIAEGAEALRRQEQTVSFENAVVAALDARKNRRQRTIYDFRYFTRRFMRRCAGLAGRRVRGIRPEECAQYIEQAFETPRQRQKARLILSGVFGTAVKRGWCSSNPVAQVEAPRVSEQPVPVLTPQEIQDLRESAEQYQGGSCAAAVGMMLYAGIRPHEVERLSWEQVDLEERAIYIRPQHSKTGGARRVSIHTPLLRILQRTRKTGQERICPPQWPRHWHRLRCRAGWQGNKPWRPDALRHTFASYHLKHFRSYAELQCEMGHRDANLLRTRYVDQRGVGDTRRFWEINRLK